MMKGERHNYQICKRRRQGFTLIELLMVLVIMSLITLAFLENQSKFDSSTIMRSLAYSIALSVRQAQVYGTSVVQNTGSQAFGPAYGVSFSTPSNSYFLFADANADGKYVAADNDAITKTFTVNSTYQIEELCAVTGGGLWRCSVAADDSSGTAEINTLNIGFKRPNPDAFIYAFQNSSGVLTPVAGDTNGAYTAAYLQVKALNGDVRVVKVTPTGQITVCGIGNISGTPSGTTMGRIKSAAASC